MYDSYTHPSNIAANTAVSERALFIQRTYNHLAGAILGFVVISYLLQQSTFAISMSVKMSQNWFIVLFAFIGVSWLAESWARSAVSREKQYMGLILYVIAEAIIFMPILTIASKFTANGDQIIAKAGVVTLALVIGITVVAFTSKKDFSFMGGFLRMASFVALGYILCGMMFGYTMGTTFAALMVVFAGGSVLYDTSNVIHHYRTDQYVSAALALFASIALMFWYVLRIFLATSND